MTDKNKKYEKIIILILLFGILTYVTLLTRLHQMTGQWEWTIIHSPAFKELLIITGIFIIGAIIVSRIRKK